MKNCLKTLLSYALRLCPAVPCRRRHHFVIREAVSMEGFANLVSMLDYAVNTRRKRHITGGLLISAALLFGGLAITVMSVQDEEDEYNE